MHATIKAIDGSTVITLLQGVDIQNSEKVTGTSTKKRIELANAIKSANKGDTIVVTKIDRRARSIFDLNKIIGGLLDKGVTVEFLNENMEFKPNNDNEPNRQNSMQSLMFKILGSFAQFERDLIVERTTEGRE
ncbi:recombinase family protein [Sporosarcina sp. ANT_H38]|uniref:recombinase family protein n=1 Tax=Sporosarcina sp. ANT_H38 TaxID=2597358 RepID=UPI0011F13010|nr:recombinase family protein [Sporosarcina sp. ANT_H38]KAA0965284.1 recombinase family protein [Sporosarcina sp. ANT_H38]